MSSPSLRIAFFGTPLFAVPTFERLLAGPHRIVVAVSQPDRPRGRGRRLSPSPIAELALRAGVPLLRPERVGEAAVLEAIRAFQPDLGVVVAFGQFLPKPLREAPRLGYLINAHASLLPRFRGAAPIARAVLEGETRTGISVMRVEREMDAGPVALVRELEIAPDETAGELEVRLAALAADAIAEALDAIAAGRVQWRAQDESAATLAPKLEREEARLDFRDDARSLARRVRAFSPRPGASTLLYGEPLRVLRADSIDEAADLPPGSVRLGGFAALRIATGRGWLLPTLLQRAGGRAHAVDEFLRGTRLTDGDRLGEQEGTVKLDAAARGADASPHDGGAARRRDRP
jgi:methionyl-tRNA formyltransferase